MSARRYAMVLALWLLSGGVCSAGQSATGSVCEARTDCARLERLCDLKEAGACTQLGDLFYRGQGVVKNVARTDIFWGLGCDGGDGAACDRLGMNAVDRNDFAAALSAFERGCSRRFLGSCQKGAMIALKAKDTARSGDLLQRACALGDDASCAALRDQRVSPLGGFRSAADEANALCVRLLEDPGNPELRSRLRALGDAAVTPMLAQVKALAEYWASAEYLDGYVIQKSMQAMATERVERATGNTIVTMRVPPVTPVGAAIVFMSQRLAELEVVDALPLMQNILASNEPISVYARAEMMGAINRLAAIAGSGGRRPAASTARPPVAGPASTNVVAPPAPPRTTSAPESPVTTALPGRANPSATWFTGRWTGRSREIGVADYPLDLVVARDGSPGRVDATFPSIPCRFRWTPVPEAGPRLVFRSEVVEGNCIASWVRVNPIDAASANVSWHRSRADSEAGDHPVMIGTVMLQR